MDAHAHFLALQLGADLQQHGVAGLQEIAELRQPLGENHRFEMTGRVGKPDDAHFRARFNAPLGARNHGGGEPPGRAARAHRARKIRPLLHAKPLERGLVIVERMAGEEKADGVIFALQALRREPRRRLRNVNRRAYTSGAEELRLARSRVRAAPLRVGEHRIDGGEGARAVRLQAIEGAGGGKAFERALVERARIDARGEIGEILKRPLAARLYDRLDRLRAHALDRGKRVDDRPLSRSLARPEIFSR